MKKDRVTNRSNHGTQKNFKSGGSEYFGGKELRGDEKTNMSDISERQKECVSYTGQKWVGGAKGGRFETCCGKKVGEKESKWFDSRD